MCASYRATYAHKYQGLGDQQGHNIVFMILDSLLIRKYGTALVHQTIDDLSGGYRQ